MGHALLVKKRYDLRLVPYHGDDRVEVSMLWSLGPRGDGGFSEVRVLRDMAITLNAVTPGRGTPWACSIQNQVMRMQSGRLLPSTAIDPRFVSSCDCFPLQICSLNWES
jgi:hypothetical protein